MANSARLIKKYQNRRLYDTHTSAYITLADVKQLVIKYEEFQVIDAKSGNDLTRNILLQIILEEEVGGAPMFSSRLLSRMIQFYGSAMQGIMGQYLENNIKAFTEMQKKLQAQSHAMYTKNTAVNQELFSSLMGMHGPSMQRTMKRYTEQSQKMFQQIQNNLNKQTRNMFRGLPFPATETSNDAKQGVTHDEPKE